MGTGERRSAERDIIEAYVRSRLVKECKQYGSVSGLARVVGFKVAHVSNILAGRRHVSEDLARRLAAHWGIAYSELEQLARGVPSNPQQDPLPNLRATIEWCRDGYPADFLREYERVAREANEDRRRREWLDDIDVELRRWARGEGVCRAGRRPPRGDRENRMDQAVRPPHEQSTASAAGREVGGSPACEQRRRTLKRAG